MPNPKPKFPQLRGKVAVYIDAANLEQSVKRQQIWRPQMTPWSVDYEKLREMFTESSQLVSINFYTPRFETLQHNRFLAYLKKNKYRIISKPVKRIENQDAKITRKCKYCGMNNNIDIKFICASCKRENDVPIERKANFDVEITADAIMWQGNFDTFVLFSGDSDFVYLAKILKRLKKTVIVLSRRGHIANELRNSPDVDLYLDWYHIKNQFLVEKSLKKPKPRSRGV